MSFPLKKIAFNDIFFDMMCEKNEDGTKNLMLRGSEIEDKIGNRINDDNFKLVLAYLRNHPEVVCLDLAYNNLTDKGVYLLSDFIFGSPTLKHLNLMGNDVRGHGIKHLAELREFFPFYSLRLSVNNLSDNACGKNLYHLIRMKSNLKFLDLSDTHLTLSNLAYVITALMPNRGGGSSSLEYINLGKPLPQPYHDFDSSHFSELIGQLLQVNDTLTELHVQQCRIDFRDVEYIAKGLNHNSHLKCLDLNGNKIADDGVMNLCETLKKGHVLECLMIGSNGITDIGAKALSQALPFSNIKFLDLTHNLIKDEGMLNVLYTIKKTIPLKVLFMWGNKITGKTLKVLARLLRMDVLNPDNLDVRVYCENEDIKSGWMPENNRYNLRFYCVPNYGYQPLPRLTPIPKISYVEPPLNFYFHKTDAELGFPLMLWKKHRMGRKLASVY